MTSLKYSTPDGSQLCRASCYGGSKHGRHGSKAAQLVLGNGEIPSTSTSLPAPQHNNLAAVKNPTNMSGEWG
ncbi:hypothetical protein E2C01_008779 [Portunus trituberculatus]|uniref:Uncharacterized protein n=1 Tax=Portunus trituberculatus TaxID=210409 RepID=A0A5B7D5L4_PORTR|nr:hypothetical protein [Portunus trituberculatus]